jgi:hypothetical protein
MTDFGHDLSCAFDLTPSMAEADGIAAYQEHQIRMLQTPRGQLYRYPNRGFDLRDQVAKELGETDTIRRGIEQELLADERALDVRADVVYAQSREQVPERFADLADELVRLGGQLTDTVLVSAITRTAEGPFTLTLGVSGVTLQLLGLSRERTRGTPRIET